MSRQGLATSSSFFRITHHQDSQPLNKIYMIKLFQMTSFLFQWHPDEYLPSNISSILSSRKRAARSHPFSTRMNFFASISAYFQHFGYDGEACLLRTICEISSTDLGEYNGAFGSLLHVLFM